MIEYYWNISRSNSNEEVEDSPTFSPARAWLVAGPVCPVSEWLQCLSLIKIECSEVTVQQIQRVNNVNSQTHRQVPPHLTWKSSLYFSSLSSLNSSKTRWYCWKSKKMERMDLKVTVRETLLCSEMKWNLCFSCLNQQRILRDWQLPSLWNQL